MNTRTVICAIAATLAAGSLLAAASALAASALSTARAAAWSARGPAWCLAGSPGDGDGWVCAVQLGNQLTRSACRSTTSSTASYRPDVIDRLRAWAGSRRAEHRALAEYRAAWRRLVRLRRGREQERGEPDPRDGAAPSDGEGR
jgi:hypothetical protein